LKREQDLTDINQCITITVIVGNTPLGVIKRQLGLESGQTIIIHTIEKHTIHKLVAEDVESA